MKTSLVIMAAGIGSRYKAGVKQLTKVGPDGEVIMDYAIYDAIKAGFGKIVFITRRDLEQQFRDVIGRRIEGICETEYVYQELSDIPAGFPVPGNRTKPWGTAQAVYCCRNAIKEPFLVLNADDYYGRSTFSIMYNFLQSVRDKEGGKYCMPGFRLSNTLSDHGTVTRGVCRGTGDGFIESIKETYGIARDADGNIVDRDGKKHEECTIVSMNMWGLTPDFIDMLAPEFERFMREEAGEKADAEWLLPNVIARFIEGGKASVKIEEVPDKWFGVTYAEDRDIVNKEFCRMHEEGIYPSMMNGISGI